MKLKPAGLLICAAVALTACGGNDDDQVSFPTLPPSGDDVPTSAKASTLAYTNYVGSLAKSETAVGLNVNQTTPPTSETDAAIAI